MKIQNVKVGNKFTTISKLFKILGEVYKKGNQGKAQIKELERYLSYEPTGKLNKNTKKVTGEIIITEIYDIPLEKEDGRTNKVGEYTGFFDMLIPQLENNRYTISDLFKAIFGSTFDVENIEYWNITDSKNVADLKSRIRDKFKSNAISNIERIERHNDDFLCYQFYHLWNDDNFKNGKDFEKNEIEEFRKLCSEEYQSEMGIEKIYRNDEKYKEYFKGRLVEKFEYENYCIMFEITNNIDEDERVKAQSKLRGARCDLRNALMKSVSISINKYNYQMKNRMKQLTGKVCYPFREDIKVLKLINKITDIPKFARTYIEIDDKVSDELKKSEDEHILKIGYEKKEREEINEQKADRRYAKKLREERKSSDNYDENYPF